MMPDDLRMRLESLIERCEWEGKNQGLPPFDYRRWYADVADGLRDALERIIELEAR